MTRIQRRRVLIAACALLTAPFALGQPAGRTVRIGILYEGQEGAQAGFWRAFRDHLEKSGYVEGKNLVIEARSTQGVSARLHAQAADLVALKPDLIVTTATPSTQAAMKATSSIPIVFAGASDPVKSGLVASLARPGGNVTGQAVMSSQLTAKGLEMLLEISPAAKKIAYLGQSSNPAIRQTHQSLQKIGRSRGVAVRLLDASTPDEIARAFELMVRDKFDGFVVSPAPVFLAHRQTIADLAARYRLPAVYGPEEFAAVGGLLSYGRDLVAAGRRAADFAHRILQGAKPAELPVEQSASFRTVVNLATARALGISIPQSILLRADRVIE
jgi:putative ABC transport system substrate-binding protein